MICSCLCKMSIPKLSVCIHYSVFTISKGNLRSPPYMLKNFVISNLTNKNGHSKTCSAHLTSVIQSESGIVLSTNVKAIYIYLVFVSTIANL